MSMRILSNAQANAVSPYIDTRSVGSKTVPIRVTAFGNTDDVTVYDIPDLGFPLNKIRLAVIPSGSGTAVLDEPTNAIQVVCGAGEAGGNVYLDFSR